MIWQISGIRSNPGIYGIAAAPSPSPSPGPTTFTGNMFIGAVPPSGMMFVGAVPIYTDN